MERKKFMQIIKLRSAWKISKRSGDYKLPNGERLSRYITDLVESQMRIDNFGIQKNGNMCLCRSGNNNNFCGYILTPAYEDQEMCTSSEMKKRIKQLVVEIIG